MTVSFPNQLRTTTATNSRPTTTHWNETVIKTCKFIGTAAAFVGAIYYLGGFEGINGRFFLPEIKMNRVFTCLAEAALLIGIAGYFEYKRSQGKEEFSSAIRARFPIDFLEQISRSNRAKPFDAPNALILTAEGDHNGALTTPAILFLFLNIAKTHRIALEIIKNKNEIRETIQHCRDATHQPIQSLIFNAHGDSSKIFLRRSNFYKLSDVKREDFEGLAPNATIFFYSCNVGRRNGLAEEIANATERTVYAIPKSPNRLGACFSFCDTHDTYEVLYFDKNMQEMLRFQKGQQPFACNHSRNKLTPYFSEMADYLSRRGELGDAAALSTRGELSQDEGDLIAAEFWYKKAAGLGDPEAQCNLGVLYSRRGDLSSAKLWFEKAADQGNSAAQYNLGAFYDKKGDLIAAEFWYKKAAGLGDPEAQTNLGALYNQKGDLTAAEFWLKKAAHQGFRPAQYELGMLYYKSGDLPNTELWIKKAADQGFRSAQTNLGALYNQKGDLTAAEFWLKKAADQGSSEAQTNLGALYNQKGDLTAAEFWLKKAAHQGFRPAQYELGVLYYKSGDLPNTELWIKKAADQGYSKAQYNLGVLYNQKGDLTATEFWYKKAADQGFRSAQYNLGVLYYKKGDLTNAKFRFHQAALQGCSEGPDPFFGLEPFPFFWG